MKRFEYGQLHKLVAGSAETVVALPNKCNVRPDGEHIAYSFNNLHLATLEDDKTIRLVAPVDYLSFKYQSMLNNILPAIGYRLISRAGVWFVLDIAHKTTSSYRSGLVLTSPESGDSNEH